MPRILGVDIPKEKRVEAALTYVYGIGWHRSREILGKAGIDLDMRAKDLSDDDVAKITSIIQNEYLTEGDLRREISQNIKLMIELGNYRGLRHRKKLPVRGQRTKTNARTRKGRKAQVGGRRK